jgi:phage terminase small subunit
VLVGEGRGSFREVRIQQREQIHAQGTAEAVEKVALTQEWVLTRLMENAERALQHVAVLDKERKPTGEYRYDGSVANRALELLGKQQGMFIDRHEVGQPNEFANWTDEELKAFIKSDTEALGIVPGKTQH